MVGAAEVFVPLVVVVAILVPMVVCHRIGKRASERAAPHGAFRHAWRYGLLSWIGVDMLSRTERARAGR